jgi:hypothetical protein
MRDYGTYDSHSILRLYNILSQFVSCLGVNPCWGWLNSNATARNYTVNLANKLNDQYNKVLSLRNLYN